MIARVMKREQNLKREQNFSRMIARVMKRGDQGIFKIILKLGKYIQQKFET